MTSPIDQLNKLLSATGLLPQMPAFRYFKHGSTAFCWNVRPLTPGADTKYREWAAWKYRVNKRKRSWRMTGRVIYFRRRKSAKNKAKQWYDKSVAQGIKKHWKNTAR